MPIQSRFGIVLALSWFLCVSHTAVQAQQSSRPAPSNEAAPLQADQVVKNLEERNTQRAAALGGFAGTRIYRLQYRGLPSDHDAEMVVNVVYHAPDAKQFSIVSETGSKFLLDHVLKKLLAGETGGGGQCREPARNSADHR